MLEHLAVKWFLIFYSSLAVLLTIQSAIWLIHPAPFYQYLRESTDSAKPPSMILKSARYLFLFATVSIIFGFNLHSPIDIAFSLGMVGLSYSTLSYLARWTDLKELIIKNPVAITRFIRYLGLIALSTTLVLGLLIYRILQLN